VTAEPKAAISSPAFQPDHFFLARTEGRGIVRDLTGRLIDRCAITTVGRWDHDYGALRFDETYVYDTDGATDVLNWTFGPDAQGRMSASEAGIKARVRGWADGPDYRLRFQRRGGPRGEKLNLTYHVRFSLMAPDLALKVAQIKLLGLTIATMTAFHRRLD
jgi:hypothetical protein